MTTAEFQADFLKQSELPKSASPEDVLSDYVRTRTETLARASELGIGNDGAKEIRQKMARAFVKRWMMLRFAAIDLSFTAREWWLKIERANGESPRIVGSFASHPTPTGEVDAVTTCIWNVGRFFEVSEDAHSYIFGKGLPTECTKDAGHLASGRRKADSYRYLDLRVTAKLPDGIHNRHAALARKAMSHYSLATALLYLHGIDLRGEVSDGGYRDKTAPTIRVIWAPEQDALTLHANPPRPVGDPAIIFSVAGGDFLLDFFDTPNEEPIEHLIREFSEGRLTN